MAYHFKWGANRYDHTFPSRTSTKIPGILLRAMLDRHCPSGVLLKQFSVRAQRRPDFGTTRRHKLVHSMPYSKKLSHEHTRIDSACGRSLRVRCLRTSIATTVAIPNSLRVTGLSCDRLHTHDASEISRLIRYAAVRVAGKAKTLTRMQAGSRSTRNVA